MQEPEFSKEESTDAVVSWKFVLKNHKLHLWVKSEVLEAIFKELSAEKSISVFGGAGNSKEALDAYFQDNPSLAYLRSVSHWATGVFGAPSDKWLWEKNTRPIFSGGLNLRALTVVGLSEGVFFPLDFPMSRSMMRDLGTCINEYSRYLVKEFSTNKELLKGSVGKRPAPQEPRFTFTGIVR